MLNAAVIGSGNMGKNHVRIYSGLKESNLIAICDPDEKVKRLAEEYGCRHYSDYRQMLDKETIDVVSVCVPTSLHYEVGKDVIEKGINVLIEKPITNNMEQAEELIRLAGEKGVKLTVGHIERFNPAVQKLKELVDQGKLGNITSIIARRVGLFPPQIKDANVIIDLAVHDIDVFNYLLGRKPVRVYVEKGNALINNREDYADIFLKYDDVNCFVQVNWITPVKIRVLNVTGTKGYAELNYVTQNLVFYKSNYEKNYNGFGDFVVKFGAPEKLEIGVEKEEPLKLELKSFLECIEKGKEPVLTGQEALDILRIALEATGDKNG
jgi:UDP-N-acetylglucosamine 3-dehydrogenase